MNDIALEGRSKPHVNADTTTRVIIIALGAVLCLQLGLAFTKSINWDEFFHYSQIHASYRGEDIGSLVQQPFVFLYGLIPSLGGSNLEQIHLIRSLILPFELLLLVAIVAAASRFTDFRTAALCGLAYASAGYAFTQGLALRADVISASLLMSAVAIALHRRMNILTLGAVAILSLLAFVATIKAVLYLPVFVGVAIVRWSELKRFVAPLAGGAVLLIAVSALVAPDMFGALYEKLGGSFERMFGGGLFPQAMHWVRQSAMASVFTVLLLGFVFWLLKSRGKDKPALALLALPALWPVIYFNAYPYFFAFILPPVAVALAPVIKIAAQRYGALALTGVFALNALALFVMEPRTVQGNQAEVQAIVAKAFPAPVTYIDESGMIGNFPRAVPKFASGWALGNYLARGEPVYSNAMMAKPVPLLIANCLTLRNAFSSAPIGERLLPADEALIRANFIPHAGIVMVAGKSLKAGADRPAEPFAIPGKYRVEGASLRIDDKVYAPGDVVSLDRAQYHLANLGPDDATLRWAEAGKPQASSITFLDLYSGY